MKQYTAIYSTASMKDIHYSFKAENLAKAIDYCDNKFNVPVYTIAEDAPDGDIIHTLLPDSNRF